MLRRFWLISTLVIVLFIAALPIANEWAAHLISTTLIERSSLAITQHQYQPGFLSSRETYHFKEGDHLHTLTIKSSTLGMGPKARVFLDGKHILNSQWHWSPFHLALNGTHQYVGSSPLLRRLQLSSVLSTNEWVNQIKLKQFNRTHHQQTFNLQHVNFISRATYPRFHPQQAKWKFNIHVGQIRYLSTHYQLQINRLQMASRVIPAQPLNNYQNRLQIANLTWRNRGIPHHFDHINTQMNMQLSAQAIDQLSQSPISEWRNWQQHITPFIVNGLNISVAPFEFSQDDKKLTLTSSINLAPTNLSHSSLDLMLLLQNTSVELHMKTNTQLIDSILPDKLLSLIERGIRNGLIHQQGQQLATDLIYQRGQLKQRLSASDHS